MFSHDMLFVFFIFLCVKDDVDVDCGSNTNCDKLALLWIKLWGLIEWETLVYVSPNLWKDDADLFSTPMAQLFNVETCAGLTRAGLQSPDLHPVDLLGTISVVNPR